jgi:hypothetical protein
VRAEPFAYRARWVDLADACLVRLSDSLPRLPVVSVESSDFAVFFRCRRDRTLIVPAPGPTVALRARRAAIAST